MNVYVVLERKQAVNDGEIEDVWQEFTVYEQEEHARTHVENVEAMSMDIDVQMLEKPLWSDSADNSHIN
ncbi:hypothetical protein Z052_02910 [Halorubrum sp. C191]|uniref:hypothetical protein n=1 Tax=Halorubrum sp. C191 TaxID=1383842 RepID=UPI000C089D71|nr:hypothetical protein [Halorubrum sp. C191]PHQ43601.1 hypothetical protein Z052_02910 [Halorubrum sp. C191]